MIYQQIGISHPIIKEIKEYKKKPNNENVVVIDDLSILELRYRYNFKILKFIFCNEKIFSLEAHKIKDLYLDISPESYIVSPKTYDMISEKGNSAGMIAIVKLSSLNFEDIDINECKFILVLDGLEIPGNLGTVFRTADAINIDLIINVDLKTSVYNPKAMSSSRGMLLKVPFINTDFEAAQKFLLDNNYRILLGEPEGGIEYLKVDYTGNIAIVVGSERFGVNSKWFNNKHERIFIPMYGEMKSLNVGVATSIILYDAKGKRN